MDTWCYTLAEYFPRDGDLWNKHFATLTNVTYGHVLGAFKKELVKRYNFTKTQARGFRDQFGTLTLSTVAYIEESSGLEMYARNRRLSAFDQQQIVDQIARDMADIFHKQCKRMGVDWLTNKPLLDKPDNVA